MPKNLREERHANCAIRSGGAACFKFNIYCARRYIAISFNKQDSANFQSRHCNHLSLERVDRNRIDGNKARRPIGRAARFNLERNYGTKEQLQTSLYWIRQAAFPSSRNGSGAARQHKDTNTKAHKVELFMD